MNEKNNSLIAKTFRFIKSRFSFLINKCLFLAFQCSELDTKSIIFESEGDLCDNAFALFEFLLRSNGGNHYNISWLVDDVNANYNERYDLHNIKFISKRIDKINIDLMKGLAQTKYFIYDHNNPYAYLKLNKRCGQTIAYLSHGRGFKAIKGFSKANFDVMFATGEIPARGLSYFWHFDYDKIIQLGFPRIDYFFQEKTASLEIVNKMVGILQYKKNIIWMPTFRQSDNKNISEEYVLNETGLPLVQSQEELNQLNSFLRKSEILIILKVHHLQAELPVFSVNFSNIKIVKDEDLRNNKIQLYQLVALTDGLITDYSSIAIDYLPLDHPIIYTLDDYEEFSRTRGFYPQNAIDYFKGYHAYKLSDLTSALLDIANNIDLYKDDRNGIIGQYFTYVDGNASERILDYLGI